MKRTRRALVACSATPALGLAACGGSGLSANSACRDYMNASPSDQEPAVSRLALAVQEHSPEADTPLGQPDINVKCSVEPNAKLGDTVASLRQ